MRNYSTIITIVATALTISSCYSDKAAYQAMIKANDKYPQKVAEFTRLYYPCISRDTDILHDTSYDFIEVACPPNIVTDVDTIFIEKFKYQTKIINQPARTVAVPTITKIINKYIRDSAEINLLEYRLEQCTIDNINYQRKYDNKSDWIKWLLIILASSLIINTLLLYNKFKR